MTRFTLKSLLLSALFGLSSSFAHAEPLEALDIAQQLIQFNTTPLRNGDNVWQRTREGFQLDEIHPELIQQHETRYTRNLSAFQRILDRSTPYLFHILNEVERRGMPTEIALLPIVESAFNPNAVSPVGATGLWQFMSPTARQYGLEHTWWYDGRRDITAATHAALDYLETLHNMFGDWHLALAAYNWGEGNLGRALARNRARGLPETFDTLQLPKETRHYVPKLLAVRNLIAHPQRYGINIKKLPNRPYFASLSTGKHIDLAIAAELAETSEEEMLRLNPAFSLPVFAHKNGRHILVPADKLERFQQNLSQYQHPLMTMQAYVVQANDSTHNIAARYQMDHEHFQRINRLTEKTELITGQTLLVANVEPIELAEPSTALSPPSDTPDTSNILPPTLAHVAPAPTKHIVQAGDTLANIARRYQVKVHDLKKYNNLAKRHTLHIGQHLIVSTSTH